MEPAIKWFEDRKGKVTYSMANRRGPNSYDCSAAVYYALIAANVFPVGIYIGNTESEFGDLEKHGWQQITADGSGNFPTQRGDVFIWGVRGDSSGANGHTGVFTGPNTIIHCSYGYNGIAESDYDWLHQVNGWPAATYYRYVGTPTRRVEAVDQVINPGSFIKFSSIFTVDDVQDIADVWQVKTTELCLAGFTWADNGIPAQPLVEVDNNGFATADQELTVGSKFIIPGKYQVLDVGQSGDRWLGQIEINGLKFWVDLEPVTEVSADDAGTPIPPQAPTQQVIINDPLPPVVQPTTPPVITPPVSPVETTPSPSQPENPNVVKYPQQQGWLASLLRAIFNWLLRRKS